MNENTILNRAQGCLLGQLCGDSLGSLVEFQSPAQILQKYPDGLRKLADGGTWNTIAGQPTDDSEMALMLARSLVEHGSYQRDAVQQAYLFWLNSEPFDCGMTTQNALRGELNPASEANGALMRISPLGIFGTFAEAPDLMRWAKEDAGITHSNNVCGEINSLFAAMIAFAIRTGSAPAIIYSTLLEWCEIFSVSANVKDVIYAAADSPPADFMQSQGWVLIAFRNALWQLLHADDLETGVVDTVMRGGDTDTNAAICGALLGAVYGRSAIPAQWAEKVLGCRPEANLPNVQHPRPECFWPVDALELSRELLEAGQKR